MTQLNVTSFTAHILGVASLQVSCDGHVISNSVPFRYVTQDSKDKDWFSLWGKNNLFDGSKVCVCVRGVHGYNCKTVGFQFTDSSTASSGVMNSRLASIVGSTPVPVKPKTIKLVYFASSLSTQH